MAFFQVILLFALVITSRANGKLTLFEVAMYFNVSFSDILQLAPFHPSFSQTLHSTFHLTCSLIHRPNRPIHFTWLKNGVEISGESNDGRYSIDSKPTMSLFTLNDVEVDDSANYTCIASDSAYRHSQSSLLQVKGSFFGQRKNFGCILTKMWRLVHCIFSLRNCRIV